MMPTTIFILAVSFLAIAIIGFVITENMNRTEEEKEHKEKISKILPETCWKVKKYPFEEDNNPFVEYYETVYKVLDMKENRIGNFYVKARRGKLFENGNIQMGDKIEVIDVNTFVNMTEKLNNEIAYID